MRFDFAIIKDKELICLIEYQGKQHYDSLDFFGGENALKKQKKYDDLKREYCRNNNIKLIEIPYWDYNKINAEYLLQKFLREVNRSAAKRLSTKFRIGKKTLWR